MSIYLPVKKLSSWQQIAFAASLIERMLPNYQLFSQTSDFGDYHVLRNQLDLAWQFLGPAKVRVNVDAQLDKLEEQIPDVNNFDSYGVYPALDVCMALSSLIQLLSKADDTLITQISQLSANSVASYVELLIESEGEADISEAMIKQHPLMQWEKDSQSELFDFVKLAKENQHTIEEMKRLALSEGVSNLGIEI